MNFVQRLPDGTLKIRTFEKGVEGETLACGTGITASALAVFSCGERTGSCPEKRGPIPAFPATSKTTTIRLQARRGDILQVDFEPAGPGVFRNIHLTGPAEFC